MRTLLKVLLVIAGLFFVLGIVCVVGGSVWLKKNKGKLMEMGDRASADGRAHGEGTDSDGCLDETLARMDTNKGLMAEVELKIFLKECLEVADAVDGFCDGVPPPGEIMKTVSWVTKTCAAEGRAGEQRCTRVVQAIQEHCEG